MRVGVVGLDRMGAATASCLAHLATHWLAVFAFRTGG